MLTAVCIGLAIASSLILVPSVRRAARAWGIVDHPDQSRKLHCEPIALGGGLAVFFALIAACLGTLIYDHFSDTPLLSSAGDGLFAAIPKQWFHLFLAAGAILIVGLIDDAWALRGRQKLLLQCLIIAALIVPSVPSGSMGGGDEALSASTATDPGVVANPANPSNEANLDVAADAAQPQTRPYVTFIGQLEGVPLPIYFAIPITFVWLLLSVNALNLIDGADGMATTAGCVICAGLGCLSLYAYNSNAGLDTNSLIAAIVAFSLVGALLGFLWFNRPPASIYLGDAGSMMIGLCVGVLAVWTSHKESTFLASIAIFAIPLFDSVAAVLRRWLTGRSLYATDRAHLHHLLQERFGPVKMLVIVAVLCGTTTTLSVLSVTMEMPILAVLGVITVLSLLVFTRSFGHAECRLLLGRAFHFAQSFATTPQRSVSEKQHRRIPMQGVGDWETIWEPLVDFARTHGMARVKIDLNLAWLHEGYHANWQSVRLPEKSQQLSICLPLFAESPHAGTNHVQIGRLEIIAAANDPAVYESISLLADRLGDLEPQINAIVELLEAKKRLADQRRRERRAGSDSGEFDSVSDAKEGKGDPVSAPAP